MRLLIVLVSGEISKELLRAKFLIETIIDAGTVDLEPLSGQLDTPDLV